MPKKRRPVEDTEFFQEIQTKYRVSREQINEAIRRLGFIKPRIRTYFEVENHLGKKEQDPNSYKKQP